MSHPVTIIGLGVMGQRMLNNMARYPGFTAVSAWDPDPAACEATSGRYPALRIAATAAEAINDPESKVVYVASPPAFHRPHALDALAAGKAVYCEKPLGVDVAESRDLAERAEASGLVNIVNFSVTGNLEADETATGLKPSDHVGVFARIEFVAR